MNAIKRAGGLAVVVVMCAVLSACSNGHIGFSIGYPNLPATSGPLTPISHCSQPTQANGYLHLTVTATGNQVFIEHHGWVFTKKHHWVRSKLLHIKLVSITDDHALLSWKLDKGTADWMWGTYQVQPSGQINTLQTYARPSPQQLVVNLVLGQQYVVYVAMHGIGRPLGCMTPNGAQPILNL